MRSMLHNPSRGGEDEYVTYFSSPPRDGARVIFLDILPMMEVEWRARSRLPPPSRGGEEDYSSSPPHDGVRRVLLILAMEECNLLAR
jgi:hypothetical protein